MKISTNIYKTFFFILVLNYYSYGQNNQILSKYNGIYESDPDLMKYAEIAISDSLITIHYYRVFIIDNKISLEEDYFYGHLPNINKIKLKYFNSNDPTSTIDDANISFSKYNSTVAITDANKAIIFEGTLKEKKTWKEIRIIKHKTYLYDKFNDYSTKRKAYLIKGDYVKIIKRVENWISIEYENIQSDKIITGWINEQDLYPLSQH